jgi:HAD superfamily hydrolase (TIGR01509 family)
MRPIVFDCDGVLVDSEELAWDAWAEVLSRYGTAPTDDEIEMLTGRTEDDAYAHFAHRMALPDRDRFNDELAVAIAGRFTRSLEAFEDAEETLLVLHERGVPMAVASSSARERLDLSLSTTGLDRFFDVSVAGDEVERGKPSPDLFLEAARKLGVAAEDCVAVEDSKPGVVAAKEAGMFVVGVQRTGALEGADRAVPRLTPAVLMHV